MKKILITGKNSYIGTSFEKWLLKTPGQYEVDTIDLRNLEWIKEDFSKYDVIFHVAGIAHVSRRKKLKDLYFRINTELTLNVAKKAKSEGVNQFIFMSSIIVYGSKNEVITNLTLPNPDNFYGESKLLAEKGLLEIESNDFKVAIIRPPMIYGKGSKGNYRKLAKLARFIPIFPNYKNERSMLYIDNLCEFIRLAIEKCKSGIFHPQNNEYVKTSNIVNQIANFHNNRVVSTNLFNPFISLFINTEIFIKLFGNLVYDKNISKYSNINYQIVNFEESIRKTENEK